MNKLPLHAGEWSVVGLLTFVWLAAVARADITVAPVDLAGADGVPDAVDAETRFYRFRFDLRETGSAVSMIYKPLAHELRAEDYYATRTNMFRSWFRLAEPDPVTGFTRDISTAEIRPRHLPRAEYRIIRHTPEELILEFNQRGPSGSPLPWADKIFHRRRLYIRDDSPAVHVEEELTNTDAEEHSLLFDVYNSFSLGRVQTAVYMPDVQGKAMAVDVAEERSSGALFVPQPAGAWLGGVNENGLGAAFSFDWPDVDAMHVDTWKTVGASYHVAMRRQTVPAGKSLTFRYTFMPFTGFGTLDGMVADLVGGVLVGEKANYLSDVSRAELKAGAQVPVRLFLASGTRRRVQVRWHCTRKEDEQVIVDHVQTLDLEVGTTATLVHHLMLPGDGLYVLTVVADDGADVVLKIEKALEVGKTRLVYTPTLPPGEKRGSADASETMGPRAIHPQLRTIDPTFVTPHLPLLKNHARGPVRAFFLTPADSTLGHVREIAQRADLDYEYATVTKIQHPDGELHPREVRDFHRRLRASHAQVIVTPAINWDLGLKREVIRDILARVEDGLGTVLPARTLEEQAELMHRLTAATEIRDEPLPICAVAVPEVRRYQLGKGRVVLVLCRWNSYRDGGEQMLGQWTVLRCGGQPKAVAEIRWRGFEYSYAFLAQLLRWAAGKSDEPIITSATLDGQTVNIGIRNPGQPATGRLSVAARNRRWEVCARGEKAAQIATGPSEHQVALDTFPEGGPLALEIHLLDDAGRVLAFGSAGVTVASPATISFDPPGPLYCRASQPGTLSVRAIGTLAETRVEVEVRDRFQRLLLRHEQNLQLNGQAQCEVALDSLRPLTTYHEVVARLHGQRMPGGARQLLAQATLDLFLLPEKPDYHDRFVLAVADGPERRALHLQGIIPTARAAGLTLHTHSHDDRVLYASGGSKAANVTLAPTKSGRYSVGSERQTLDGTNLVMNPPLLPSDEAERATQARWTQAAKRQFETGAFMLFLDDERRMSGDFDMHPQTLAGFRRWLQTRYADIAELNRTWGTDFADFSQVLPRKRQEVAGAANLAPWLEFRMYIGEVLGKYYMQRPGEWAAAIDPRLSAAEYGIYEPSADWPVDWSRYASAYKDTSRYGDAQGVLEELFRCFAPGTNHGPWRGYGMLHLSPGRRVEPWQALFHGGHFIWYWAMVDNGYWNYGVCTSDQRLTEGYASLAREEFPDITGGIDRLIIASRFADDGIAIAYSYPSWLADRRALGGTSKLIVEELGFQHHFINLADLAATGQAGTTVLDPSRFRLLVIQHASCLSVEQMEAVRRFAEAGGTVFCIGRIGWRNLHGAPHAQGALADSLTGVDTSAAAPLELPLTTNDPARPLRLVVEYKGVDVRQAQILASAEVDGATVPVWTVREVGRGKVYWLNSTLGEHQTIAHGGAAGEISVSRAGPQGIRLSHWDIFDNVIASAGIRPRCRAYVNGQPLFGAETWYYESPSRRSLFVARYILQEAGEPLTLRLTRRAHVYEARAGRYMGLVDSIQDTFPPGHVHIYALLDYRVAGLAVKPAAQRVRRGGTATFSCEVLAGDAPEGRGADLHALRVRVSDPQGRELPAYWTTVLAPEGRAEIRLPLALDEAIGPHQVMVTDVISGEKATAQFHVEE